MHRFFIKTHWLVKKLYPAYVWSIPGPDKAVYLTFDDGPHPEITPWVLDVLKECQALATFFCIGNNVVQYPAVYRRILSDGHAVGNHTHTHPNGWATSTADYIQNVKEAAQYIQSYLFRPPYGKIKRQQAKAIPGALGQSAAKIIMWDVLSADFDTAMTGEACLQNVLRHVTKGSVIVFHDSEKAAPRLQFVLPKVLDLLSKEGYIFKRIE